MKVLIISHNPITTYQNMGKTFLSLFSSFDKSELCQLYIYPTIPDIDVCNSYYRTTDKDILKSYFHFGKVNSQIVEKKDIEEQAEKQSKGVKTFQKKKRKTYTKLIGRDIMWSFSHWYNSSLEKWLEEEKPDCIFLAPGQSKFIYNIANKISKKLNIDIISYVCDDYYFMASPKKLTGILYSYLLKKKIRKIMKISKQIITISDGLSVAYNNEFGTETETISTGTNYLIAKKPNDYCDFDGITYMGNIGCNRHIPIAEIGRCLDEINKESGTKYSLYLYTTPLNEVHKKEFCNIKSIQYMGFVAEKEFYEVLHNSPILLHVEAFDSESKDRVKYSVSTKIADSLGSGNLLFAYGPSEVASIKHLVKNNCAKVVVSRDKLKEALIEIFCGTNREEVISNALLTAGKYHTSSINSNKLKSIIKENGLNIAKRTQ